MQVIRAAAAATGLAAVKGAPAVLAGVAAIRSVVHADVLVLREGEEIQISTDWRCCCWLAYLLYNCRCI